MRLSVTSLEKKYMLVAESPLFTIICIKCVSRRKKPGKSILMHIKNANLLNFLQ